MKENIVHMYFRRFFVQFFVVDAFFFFKEMCLMMDQASYMVICYSAVSGKLGCFS